VPHPVFDSQLAAMVCGYGDQISYENLLAQTIGVTVDKSSRFTDWSRRPLSDRQIEYALADVTHLRPVYEKLAKRMKSTGRDHWLDEEMAVLTSPATYRTEPEDAWRRIKGRGGKGKRFLGILIELAAWREREAQRRDVPRGRVLRDEQLYDIAAHTPRSAEELARSRGLGKDLARGRIGKAILEVVAEGLALPEAEHPMPAPKVDLPKGIGPVVDLLKVLLKMRCEQHNVAQRLVASVADLEQIAADDQAKVPALPGWRREIFGADALALKQGRQALSADGRRVVMVPVSAPRAAQ
jgi:ribonuclease D